VCGLLPVYTCMLGEQEGGSVWSVTCIHLYVRGAGGRQCVVCNLYTPVC